MGDVVQAVVVVVLLGSVVVAGVGLVVSETRESRWRRDAPRRANDPDASDLVRARARAIMEWDALQAVLRAQADETRREEQEYRKAHHP